MSDFWNEYLKGSICEIAFPTLPQSTHFSAQRVIYEIDPIFIKNLLKSFNNSIEDMFLAAFAAILAIYTQQNDLIIGIPPLLIRVNVDLTQTFSQLIKYVQTQNQLVQGKKPPLGIAPHASFQENGQDLSLFCEFANDTVILHLNCRQGLYDYKFLKRMATNIVLLLEKCSIRLDEPIHTFDYVAPDELAEIFLMGRGSRSPFPKNLSVQSLFEKNLVKYSNNPAIYYEGSLTSYAELNAQANQLARHLKTMSIQKGEFVGLAVDRSLDYIVCLLGILKADAVAVPIDASYPIERKIFMIEDAKVKLLISQYAYRDLFPIKGISVFFIDEQRDELQGYSIDNVATTAGSLDIININYTSGSTGKPKGVKSTHRGIIRLVTNTNWVTLTPQDKIIHMANVSFDAASFEIWGALLNGACLYVYPHREFSAQELAQFLRQNEITHALFTARLFNLLIEFELSSLKFLRFFASGGDVMSVFHTNRALEALPGCALVNVYGPTENGVCATSYTAYDISQIDQVIPIGTPINNTDIYILDSRLHPVPIGVAGEICCGGEGVAEGYLNRPDANEKVFIPNPFGEGTLYRTGDLGRFWPNGQIEFLGRIDNQVKIRGFRVELGEIEECARTHPNVADCVVIVHTDHHGDKRLAAYAEPRAETSLTTDDLRTYLASKLIANVMPAFVFVIPKLPTTPNGKVDRKALSRPEQLIHQEEKFEKPDTSIEEIIADIWASLLELPRIGKRDNFLFLGGDSITASEMIIMVSEAFNIKIPMALIFNEPVLEQFAKKIKNIIEEVGSINRRSITTSELFWVWRNREIRLDSSITADELSQASDDQYRAPKSILLTGATGFVGSFMLKELIDNTDATINCVVRANSKEDAKRRIEAALKYYSLWSPETLERVIPIIGDLESPNLGIDKQEYERLTREVDSIYHIGAYVNHTLPYSRLKAANVDGTIEVLKIACKNRIKPFNYFSTLAVLEHKNDFILDEDANLLDSKLLINGYAESKWVAEKLVMEARSRSLPINIFRLGRVSGHSRTGQGNVNDFLWRIAEASIHLQLAPDIGLKENITPVDYVCSAIRTIACNPDQINRQYHVINNDLFPYRDIFTILQKQGYSLTFMPYEHWRQTLIKTAMETKVKNLQAVTLLFSEVDLSHSNCATIFGSANVSRALAETGIVCPQVDEQMIVLYINALVAKGFFPPNRIPVNL